MTVTDTPPTRPRKPGRPLKLTPDLQARLVARLEAGHYLDASCHLEGIGASTVLRWMSRGADEAYRLEAGITPAQRKDNDLPTATAEAPYREFREAVLAARARAEDTMVGVVRKVAVGGYVVEERTITEGNRVEVVKRVAQPDGKLALEYLSRVAPQRWGRMQRVELAPAEREGATGHDNQDAATARELRAGLDAFYLARGEEPPPALPPAAGDEPEGSSGGWELAKTWDPDDGIFDGEIVEDP